jgi:Rod binding domain-containing protein
MNEIAPGNFSQTEKFAATAANNGERLSSAAKEFESVLLGQWLKDAESSFGSVPGSEEDDAGGEQMQDFALQHVATEITDRGGIGVAQMVERALAKQEIPRASQSGGDGR